MVASYSLMGIIQPLCTKCCLFIAFLRRSNSIRSIWCLQLVISTKIDQDIKYFRFTSNLYSGNRNRDAKLKSVRESNSGVFYCTFDLLGSFLRGRACISANIMSLDLIFSPSTQYSMSTVYWATWNKENNWFPVRYKPAPSLERHLRINPISGIFIKICCPNFLDEA